MRKYQELATNTSLFAVKPKDRLIEITVDETISSDEINDFKEIRKRFEQMSTAIDSMQLWPDNMIAEGKIDKTC